jgi:Heterokaryon incompatibility protein (HET)
MGKRQLTSGDNGSEEALQLATGWLHDCITSHPECSATEACALPDRVVDIGLPEEPVPRLRLMSGKGVKGRYACLSHRWDPETPKTTLENIDEHLKNIRWDSLSETFQDAITFLGKLSLWHNCYHGEPIRYIWIDSLCIIQNSESDWQEQSQKMCEVYSNALITFVESHWQGRDKRLFSKASRGRTAKAIPVTDAEGRTREFYFRFPIIHPDFQNGGNRVPIWTRGWVLQERLLSPRLLVFGSEELSWKCSGCNKCECGLDQVYMDHYNGMTTWRDPQVGRLNPINRKNMNLIIGNDPSESQLRMAWRLILESYSQLKLTYRKDTLAALAGLARSFDKQLGGRKYFTGFWYEERDASPPLHQTETMLDLLWRLEYSQDSRRDNRPDSPISQSWSWASPQCSIVYPFARDKLIKTYSGVADFRALPISAGFAKDSGQPGTFSNDMYTDTTPTMLVMAGPLFGTQLREEKHFLKLAKTEDREYVYFLGAISDLTQHSAAMGGPIETKLSLVEPPRRYNLGSDEGPFAKTPPIVFYPDNEGATVSGAIYCLPIATFLHDAMKGELRERRIFVALVLEQVGRLEAADILTRDPTTFDTGSLVFRRLGLAYTMDRSWNDEFDIWDRYQLSVVRII